MKDGSISLDFSPAAPCLSKSLVFPASKQFPHCDELGQELHQVNSLRLLVTAFKLSFPG